MENFKKIAMKVGLLVASASLMTACGNKNSGDSPAPAPAGLYGGACTASCPTAPVQVATAVSSGYGMVFSFAMIGDQMAVNQAQYSGGIYQGPIAFGGTLQVGAIQQIGNCLIQPGTYQITTLQGAQVTMGGTIGTIRLRMQGPTIFDMTWNNAMYLSTSQHLTAYVTTDQGPGYGVGQLVPCNDPLGPMLF